jgi:hypothetical protein
VSYQDEDKDRHDRREAVFDHGEDIVDDMNQKNIQNNRHHRARKPQGLEETQGPPASGTFRTGRTLMTRRPMPRPLTWNLSPGLPPLCPRRTVVVVVVVKNGGIGPLLLVVSVEVTDILSE